jgi:flagellar biosynthesis protein FliP
MTLVLLKIDRRVLLLAQTRTGRLGTGTSLRVLLLTVLSLGAGAAGDVHQLHAHRRGAGAAAPGAGHAGLPPSQVIVGLALFMTLLVMAPTFERDQRRGDAADAGRRDHELQAWERAKQPLRDFMFAQIEYAGQLGRRVHDPELPRHRHQRAAEPHAPRCGHAHAGARVHLSELKIAFLIGFRLYLPFLIIDMVMASMLISMGMMMLPPVLISLPFKLLLFVLVDGWMLVGC